MANTRGQLININPALVRGNVEAFQVALTRDCFVDDLFDPSGSFKLDTTGGALQFYDTPSMVNRLACQVVGSVVLDTTTGAGDGTIEVHVLAPYLLKGRANTLFVTFGDNTLSQPAVDAAFGSEAVWPEYADGAGGGVWHLNEASGTLNDSSANNNHAAETVGGATYAVSAKLGTGLRTELDGNPASLQKYTLTSSITSNSSNRGFSFWFNPTSTATFGAVFGEAAATVNNRLGFKDTESPATSLRLQIGGTWTQVETLYGLVAGDDYFVCFDFDGVWHVRVNHMSGVPTADAYFTVDPGILIGSDTGGARCLHGVIDEMRAGPYRSKAWRDTEYNNQRDPGAFAVAGATAAIDSDWGELVVPATRLKRHKITIPALQVATGGTLDYVATLTRDAFLDEVVSPTDGNRSQSDGGDLWFTSDEDGYLPLPFDVVAWEYDTTDAAGDADVEVKVHIPVLSSSAANEFYFWYHSSGTSTLPAAGDINGADNAYPYNLVAYMPDGGTADVTQYANTGTANGGLTAGGATGKIVAGTTFDGTDDSVTIGPKMARMTSFETPGGWTCTGLTWDTDAENFWIGDHLNSEIVEVSTAGVEISSFTLGYKPQGIAFDTSDNTLWVADNVNQNIFHYSRAGVEVVADRISSLGYAPNGIGYEAATDTIWVASDGSNTLRQYSCSTGSLVDSFSVSFLASRIDGVEYDASTDELIVSHDTTDTLSRVIASGARQGEVTEVYLATNSVEDIALVNGDIYFCADAGLHNSVTDGNRVYKLDDRGQDRTVMLYFDPGTLTTGSLPDAIFMHGDGITTTGFTGVGYGLALVGAGTTIRLFINDDTNRVFADRTISFPPTNFMHAVLEIDRNQGVANIYVDGAKVGASADITTILQSAETHYPMMIGAVGVEAANRFLQMTGDEFMWFDDARGAAWIETYHNNTNAPANFFTPGVAADVGGNGFPTELFQRNNVLLRM